MGTLLTLSPANSPIGLPSLVTHASCGGMSREQSGTPAWASGESFRKRTRREVADAFIERLRARDGMDVEAPGFIQGIYDHFDSLPSRCGAPRQGLPWLEPARRPYGGFSTASCCRAQVRPGREHRLPGCAQSQAAPGQLQSGAQRGELPSEARGRGLRNGHRRPPVLGLPAGAEGPESGGGGVAHFAPRAQPLSPDIQAPSPARVWFVPQSPGGLVVEGSVGRWMDGGVISGVGGARA